MMINDDYTIIITIINKKKYLKEFKRELIILQYEATSTIIP